MKMIKRLLAVCVCVWMIMPLRAQNPKMEVRGTVMDDDGLPAISIVIRDKDENGAVYGITDMDGKFKITADPAATLHFSGLTYAPKVVKLKGKSNINVIISFETKQLDEVVVTAKRLVNKITPEPTDIEIVGNQYIIHPKIKIPQDMFKPDSRVMAQPVLVNMTKKTERLFRPAVVTGKRYAIALERMMEFDSSQDPLYPYYEKGSKIEGNQVITYIDSLYMDNPDDECRCDIYLFLVDYKKVKYKDTVTIAKGTVNPMRFFDFKISARSITDERYIPRPQKQLRGDKGQVHLTFLVNSAMIDDANPNNATELEKMRRKLVEIDNDPNAEFMSFSVTGISSPEGSYQSNLKLAQKRTLTARNKMMGFLSPTTVAALRDSILTDARVESWNTIAGWMEKDSLDASAIRSAVELYPNDMTAQFSQIVRLPVYRSVIADKYLPHSRRVEYQFNYSVMRQLNDSEICRMYEQDYRKLVPYEFWRMYAITKEDSLKEKICRQALEQYPDFMLAANELAVKLIDRKASDARLLEPFVDYDAPQELLCNQAIALLDEHTYQRADSVISLLPIIPETVDVRSLVKAFNGDFEPAYEYFAPKGGVNEVVLLLSLKRNKEAWEKAQELPEEDAVSDYLRAVCANRLDMFTEAFAYLKRAVREDPSLMDVARIDGDVTDIVQQLDDEKKEKGESI